MPTKGLVAHVPKSTFVSSPAEIENIFKDIDTEEKIRELFDKNYQVQEEKIDNIVKSLNEENKFAILRRNLTNKSTSEIKI
ncbi:hypothetical protein [Rickettsia honei]|uniref:hypothetical protein n=1 Tax=Rickettsia honei TaxID=37816 RepID=UPI001427BE09|nr:hypothetical protein [Rickettsia honei]